MRLVQTTELGQCCGKDAPRARAVGDLVAERLDGSLVPAGGILGDGAGAAVLKVTDDSSKGVLAQSIHADGPGWKEIFVPQVPTDFPTGIACDPTKYNRVQMNGAGVFKFAVGTFPELIQQTLDKAGLKASDVDMFVCHQSNARILQAARDRFGLAEDKLYVNIERVGNTVGASVPLCLDDLVRSGRMRRGYSRPAHEASRPVSLSRGMRADEILVLHGRLVLPGAVLVPVVGDAGLRRAAGPREHGEAPPAEQRGQIGQGVGGPAEGVGRRRARHAGHG